MHELLDELTSDAQRSLSSAKYKIMSCVLLSKILLDKDSINENGAIYKAEAVVDRDTHPNDTLVKKHETSVFDKLDEFALKDMVFDKKLPTLNTALKYIQDAQIWSFLSTTQIKNTNITMYYYRCKLISDTGDMCPAKNCLISDLSSSAFFYRSIMQHNHSYNNQMHAKMTCSELADNDDDKQSNMLLFDIIEKSIPPLAYLPKDFHTVYCVDYVIYRDLKKLRCFLSTRQLLKSVLASNSIHISSLNTIHWNKFEVILVGTTDLKHNFHHFGLAVCNSKSAADYEFIFSSIQKGVTENYPNRNFTIDTLLSDYNPVVQNAFKYVFGLKSKAVTCLFNFNSHISKLFQTKNYLIEDINKLQILGSTDLFNIGVQLFLKKWHKQDLELFKSEWLDKNNNWYEGCSYFIPSYNTAIQNEYEQFRKSYLNVNLGSFDLLLNQLVIALTVWSNSYKNGNKFEKQVLTPMHLIQAACRWLRHPKNIEKETIKSNTFYYLHIEHRSSKEALKAYCGREFDSLDHFLSVRSKYCTVRKNENNELMCDCKVFFKDFVCHHSIGVGYLLNLYKIPLELIPDPSAIPYYLKLDD